MADIVRRPAFAASPPWRAIGLALVLIALLVAAAVAISGSRQGRVPAPFGLARNGLIAYALDGDILLLDPEAGVTRPIVTGTTDDGDPKFSPDGTRIAFRRGYDTSAGHPEDIVIADSDGSNQRVITPSPIAFGPGRFEWTPDSRGLFVEEGEHLRLYDIAGEEAPRAFVAEPTAYERPFRPPEGRQVLVRRETDHGSQIVAVDLEGGPEVVLASGGSDNDFGSARWSPDGSHVVYNSSPAEDAASQRLFIVRADGTGTRQITDARGIWFDINATWSPDGTRIAFVRYERVDTEWDVRSSAIYSVADGTIVAAGPLPRDVRAQAPTAGDGSASPGEGFSLEWSPDGTMLLAVPSEASGHPVLIDPDDGSWQALDIRLEPADVTQIWQRRAP